MTFLATDLSVHFGHTKILHGVEIKARAGEVTAIVGPNGSGKTTLLRALTGEIAYSGRVTINGHNTKDLKIWELASMRGVLPQTSAITFPFTVLEVVRLGLRAGLSATDTDLPQRALARVDLSGFENRFYQSLSGGEQQRVQLARVLAQIWEPLGDGTPRWLLLDEPVASLDIGHQFVVMDIARDFATQGGGVIAVMHDLNLTAMFSDQVFVMSNGSVAINGPPKDTISNAMLSDIYHCALKVNEPPLGDIPFILPQARQI